MRAAVAGTITELGTLDGAMGEALFLLPQRIDSLRVPFGARVDLALRGAADGTAPLLRGVYCVGAVPDALSTAADPTADPTAGTARPAAPRRSPAFAARVWRRHRPCQHRLA